MSDHYAEKMRRRIKELTDQDIPVGVCRQVLSEIMQEQRKYDRDERLGRFD